MKHLKALVLMQLKDKLDLSFLRAKKTLIRKIVFTLLKFIAVGAITYLFAFLLSLIGLFNKSDTARIMVVLTTFILGISLLSCTVGLVKSLYFADDNRVLITFPVGTNEIFISKLVVYYIYELAREMLFLLPILIGCAIHAISYMTFWFVPWSIIVMVFIPMLPVLIGSLLSIPALYLARLGNRFPVVKVAFFVGIAGLIVWAVVKLIGLLPENIDLVKQGPSIIQSVSAFLLGFERAIFPITWLVSVMTGVRTASNVYMVFAGRTFLYFLILIAIIALLLGFVYLVSRPIFFKMMSKSFEFEKKAVEKHKLNKQHTKWYAFTLKEFKLCVANVEVSLSFIVTYIAVPVLIYLLNKLYAAMNTRLQGEIMTYSFNILIMLLPMLASNGIIATLYSKEGRAGYMKKTEPINILQPLFAKLVFFFAMSLPSVIATVVVFGQFNVATFKWYDIVLLAGMLLFTQYAHIIFSAMLDILNPQNEQYATIGESAKNPNENVSTISAFILSIFLALFSYVLFGEETLNSGSVTISVLKLCLIGGGLLISAVVLFVKSVKAFYYDK